MADDDQPPPEAEPDIRERLRLLEQEVRITRIAVQQIMMTIEARLKRIEEKQLPVAPGESRPRKD